MYNFYLPGMFEAEEEEIPPTKRQGASAVPAQPAVVLKQPEYKCCRCKDWFKDVEPNQEDGTFKCWSCREDPYR